MGKPTVTQLKRAPKAVREYIEELESTNEELSNLNTEAEAAKDWREEVALLWDGIAVARFMRDDTAAAQRAWRSARDIRWWSRCLE
jgi:hypothetical protein